MKTTIAQTSSARTFINSYGTYFGQRRLEAIERSGKFLLETKAEGAYIHDGDGKRYLDFFCDSGVYTLGHGHPAVRSAVENALRELPNGGVFYFSEAKGNLARRISQTAPPELQVVLPAAGGGEAMDLALKLAMGTTGRTAVICGTRAYHGSSGLAAFLAPVHLREWFPLNPFDVKRVDLGDLDGLKGAIDERTAAVVYEPARTLSDGFHPGPAYWQEVRRLCDAAGAKLIIDEVVAGMGRLGTLWGCLVDNVKPDMMVCAKGLSGGMFPMAALAVRPEMLACWGELPFRSYSTFAWMTAGAVAAAAAIEETLGLLPSALIMAEALERGLQQLVLTYPAVVTGVRRTGMHLTLEFDPHRMTGGRFTQAMFDRGVLLHAAGSIVDAPAKFFPPLVLTQEQIDECLEKTESVLQLALG